MKYKTDRDNGEPPVTHRFISTLAPRVTVAALVSVVACYVAWQSRAYGLEARSLLGTWNTNFGPITVTEANEEAFVGIYSYQNTPARIYAVRSSERIFEGYWVQETSEVRCREAKKAGIHGDASGSLSAEARLSVFGTTVTGRLSTRIDFTGAGS